MAFLPLNDLKSFDNETLTKEIVAAKKQLFELRLKKATRQSFKPHLFKHFLTYAVNGYSRSRDV